MPSNAINHVSAVADDLEESVAFYAQVLGMERVPSPNVSVDIEWLEDDAGFQLHLFDRDVPVPRYHHFGITVADFESVYRTATERGIVTDFRDAADATGLYELPDGAVQLYLTDPAGNLVEVNWPDVETLPASIRERVVDRSDLVAQTGEAAESTLGLE